MGTNASKVLRLIPSGTTLFRWSAVPWVPFTNCQKKAEVPPSALFDAITPSPKGSEIRLTDEILTSRRHHDKTSLP